jgi:hypothetical protein
LILPDLFISHASEDKPDLVRPLADAHTERGLKVWLDERSMRVGDSLRRSIDGGILRCNTGVLVLSPHFLRKEWPLAEADALISEMVSKDKLVIPIWHGVTHAEVREFSPILADRFALRTPADIGELADKICEAREGIPLVGATRLRAIVRRLLWADEATEQFLIAQCEFQVKRWLAYSKDTDRYREEAFGRYDELTDDERKNDELFERYDDAALALMAKRHAWLAEKYDFPAGMWIEAEEIDEDDAKYLSDSLSTWVAGVLGIKGSEDLFFYMDDTLNLDILQFCFGIPNFSVTKGQRELLYEVFPLIGDSFNLDDEQRSAYAAEKLLDRIAPKPDFEPDD